MDKPGDGADRLRKAREAAKRKQEAMRKRETFVPYRTMFKLGHPRPSKARQLECVACGREVEWRIYTLAPDKFDNQCPTCGVQARDYWSGRQSKELPNAPEEEESS